MPDKVIEPNWQSLDKDIIDDLIVPDAVKKLIREASEIAFYEGVACCLANILDLDCVSTMAQEVMDFRNKHLPSPKKV